MNHNYRIAFRIGDSSFDIESTDLDWLKKKEKEYLEKVSKKATHKAKLEEEETPQVLPKNLTINEFYKRYIKAHNITSRADIAVLFVYYLQKVLKSDTIRTSDIAKSFGDISYPNYNKLNFTDILNQAKRKAFLNNINNLWSLTITGEDFVINAMVGEDK